MLTIDEKRCKGCSLCVKACPKKILRLNPEELNSKGFHPVQLTEEDKCISCAFCAIMCPDLVIKVEKQVKA